MPSHRMLVAAMSLVTSTLLAGVAHADMAAAKKWIDDEFQPSALSKEEQMEEMDWFAKAAAPFKGMEINVLSETIPTHEYESKTLAKAFDVANVRREDIQRAAVFAAPAGD